MSLINLLTLQSTRHLDYIKTGVFSFKKKLHFTEEGVEKT
jgi:hypothetical protein